MSPAVARYTAVTPDLLAQLIQQAESELATIQSRLSAMRKAQRIQKTIAKGGKLPSHTKGEKQ